MDCIVTLIAMMLGYSLFVKPAIEEKHENI